MCGQNAEVERWYRQLINGNVKTGLGIIQNRRKLGLFHGSLVFVAVVVFMFVVIVSVVVIVVQRLIHYRGRRPRRTIGCGWERIGPLTTVDV